MKNPRVKFRQNKELDKWKIEDFLYRGPQAKVDFRQIILGTHRPLRLLMKLERKKASLGIEKYVDEIYVRNKEGIKKTVKRMQLDWRTVESNFYKVTNPIFKNIPWPNGEYIAYFSISPPMPRFLNTKTFQVGYTKDGRWKTTVAHEMLHFIFYEYIRKTFTPQLKNTIEKEMEKQLKGKLAAPLWDLSEVFNVILLNGPKFQQLFPGRQSLYPKHNKLYPKLQKVWRKTNGDIDLFLKYLTSIPGPPAPSN